MSNLIRKSKKLSFYLRHNPELICPKEEIKDDAWIPYKWLLKAGFSIDELEKIVASDNKKRYQIDHHEKLIRACQGHSYSFNVKFKLVENPPKILYHGTSYNILHLIKSEGLIPMARQYVHLSPDIETATVVSKRRSSPVILKIDTEQLLKECEIYLSSNNVFLCKAVSPKYILNFK